VSLRRLFLLVYGISGAAGLLYEVAWTRLLTLQMGHTVAAASTVLAAYMGGMALGSFVAGRIAPSLSRRRGLIAYAGLEALIGGCALLMPLVLLAARPLVASAYADGNGGAAFGLARLVVGLVSLILPTAAMGATFPLATRWQVEEANRAGGEAGALYAANTIGACAGAIVAGFLLLPWLGAWRTTLIGALLNATVAAMAVGLANRVRGEDQRVLGDRAVLPPAGHPEDTRAVAPLPGGPRQPAGARAAGMSAGARPGNARQRGVGRPPQARTTMRGERGASRPVESGQLGLAAFALTVSGFVALVFEVAWTRILALAVGPTSYAFSLMLATFIGGLACGSTASAWLVDRVRRPTVWLAGTLTIAASMAFAALALTGEVPLAVARAAADPRAAFGSMIATEWKLMAGVLLPLSTALGAAMPLAIAVGRRSLDTIPRDVAFVYTMNTLGAIGGALGAGFLLIPLLGLHATIVAAAGLALAAAAVVILLGVGDRMPRILGATAIVTVALTALSLPGWDPALMSSGGYKYAAYLGDADLDWTLRAGDLLYYRDGAAGTVSVRRLAGTVSLAIDGKVDASNGGDMLTQQLLAHLPLLVHGAAHDVCVIGLGSGVTLGAALAHPIRRADVIELSPDVVAASAFFERENHHALADPRSHLIVGDGRSHLLFSSRQYDVIISEPSNPWMSGMAALFTREFFTAARARLRPDGVLCQWTHTYDISEASLRSIVATFTSVFPHATAWLVGDEDLLLIGSAEPVAPRLERLLSGFDHPSVAASLAEVAASAPFDLLALCLGDDVFLRAYGNGAPVQTDDRLELEYSAPRSIWGRPTEENVRALRQLAANVTPPGVVTRARAGASAVNWRTLAEMELRAEAAGAAYEAFARAAELDPADLAALDGLGRAAGLNGRQAEVGGGHRIRHAVDRATARRNRSPPRAVAAAGERGAGGRGCEDGGRGDRPRSAQRGVAGAARVRLRRRPGLAAVAGGRRGHGAGVAGSGRHVLLCCDRPVPGGQHAGGGRSRAACRVARSPPRARVRAPRDRQREPGAIAGGARGVQSRDRRRSPQRDHLREPRPLRASLRGGPGGRPRVRRSAHDRSPERSGAGRSGRGARSRGEARACGAAARTAPLTGRAWSVGNGSRDGGPSANHQHRSRLVACGTRSILR